MNKSIIHAVVGTFGTLIIVTFLSATLIAELFLTYDAVIL